ncbi:carboxypeptidase regulatory-like domain-containing protein, partial [Nocardioides marmoriginsengisoli]
IGEAITVEVTGTLAGHTTTVKTSSPTAAVTAAPVPPVTGTTPTINGTPQVDQVLTATPGTWGPSGVALAYQWFAGADEITGATNPTYTPVTGDIGDAITVQVTGTLAGHTTTVKTSSPTAAVTAAPLPPVTGTTPRITGTARTGSTLTAVPGAWGPAGVHLTYRWFANDTVIAGARSSTFKPRNTEAGRRITVEVTGTSPGVAAVTKRSAPTATSIGVLTPTAVTITGTRKVGRTLSASTGSWGPKPVALSYRWYRDGKLIPGQVRRTYKLRKADKGKRISVRVYQSKTSYLTANRVSAKTGKIK